MNKVVLSGVIDTIFATERYGNFEKRVFWVLETGPKYPQVWQLEMWHEDTLTLDMFKPGHDVIADVEVKGKKVSKGDKEMVINILRCTKLTRLK